MSQNLLRRTVLAVAISSASMGTYAVSPSSYDMAVQGRIELTGTVTGFEMTGTASGDQDFVEIYGAEITGDIVNNAILTGAADQINGIDIDRADFGDLTVFNGSLNNIGSLTMTGVGANGILLDGVVLGGSVLNNGTINVTGEYDEAEGDGATGIKFNEVVSLGDTRNDGTITVSGTKAKGMTFESSELAGYLINSNAGVIDVSGEDSAGLHTYDTNLDLLANYGAIQATGANATALDIDATTFRVLVNSGTIQGQGAGSVGLMLDDAITDHDDEYSLLQHGLINSGTISGEHIGLLVEGLDGDIPLYINMNRGLIEGGEAAISAINSETHLNWKGGTIRGDILNVGDIEVGGYATFEGDLISTTAGKSMNVGSTGYLDFDGIHTTLESNLNVAEGGTIRLLITPETAPSQAVLNVTGDVVFEHNSAINIEARPIDFGPNNAGTPYVLLSANSIQDNGVAVNSVSYLLELKGYTTENGQLVATVGLRDYQEIEEIIEQSGASSNGQAAFIPMVSVLGNLDENDPVFQAIVNATPEERAVIAEQLSPEVNGGTTTAAVSGAAMISGATSTRTDSLRGDSSGEALADTGAWFQILNSDANQDVRDNVEGFDADTNGFTIGADAKVNENVTLGLAYSYLDSDVKSDGGNTTDVKGHNFTLYSGLSYGNWFADGNVTFGFNDNTSKRHIVGTTAKGDYDSDLFAATLEGGYAFHTETGETISPFGIVRYANIDIDSYTESGSSAALDVGAQRYEMGDLGLGIKANKGWAIGNGTLTGETKISATYDVIGDKTSANSSFVLGSSAFTTNGADPARTALNLGLGADYQIGNFTVGASYERSTREDYSANTFVGKVRYDF